MGANRERARGVVDYWYDGTNVDEDTKASMARAIERALDEAVREAVAPFMDAIEIEDGLPVAIDWNLLTYAIRARSSVKP